MTTNAAVALFNGTPELYAEYVATSGDNTFGGPGKQAIWNFPNGYGASVILSDYSYGLELAVLHGDDLCYRSGTTEDVIGWIESPIELAKLLKRIKELPQSDDCGHSMCWADA